MYMEQKIYCLNPIEHYSGTVPAVNLCVKNIIYIPDIGHCSSDQVSGGEV